jgi:hypothetical protein
MNGLFSLWSSQLWNKVTHFNFPAMCLYLLSWNVVLYRISWNLWLHWTFLFEFHSWLEMFYHLLWCPDEQLVIL